MRDGVIIQAVNELKAYINQVRQSFQLASTGEAIRAQALHNLLVAKGIFTEQEMTAELTKVIQEAQKAEEKPEEAKTIVAPTPAEVVNIAKTVEK